MKCIKEVTATSNRCAQTKQLNKKTVPKVGQGCAHGFNATLPLASTAPGPREMLRATVLLPVRLGAFSALRHFWTSGRNAGLSSNVTADF